MDKVKTRKSAKQGLTSNAHTTGTGALLTPIADRIRRPPRPAGKGRRRGRPDDDGTMMKGNGRPPQCGGPGRPPDANSAALKNAPPRRQPEMI